MNQKYHNFTIRPVFLMGVQRDPFGREIDIHEEDVKAGDIYQSAFPETFYNLVLKDYQLVRWANRVNKKLFTPFENG